MNLQNSLPKFQEEYSAKLPALTLLTQLGWRFLSPEAALSKRGGRTDGVVLRPLLREALAQRRFHFVWMTSKNLFQALSNHCLYLQEGAKNG